MHIAQADSKYVAGGKGKCRHFNWLLSICGCVRLSNTFQVFFIFNTTCTSQGRELRGSECSEVQCALQI